MINDIYDMSEFELKRKVAKIDGFLEATLKLSCEGKSNISDEKIEAYKYIYNMLHEVEK